MILFYGLATATFAIAIAEDAYTKLMVIHIVEARSDPKAIPESSFMYTFIEKYQGNVQYKVVNPLHTLLWVLPSSLLKLKVGLDHLASLPFIFTWLAVGTLLSKYYKSKNQRKFQFKFWVMLTIPLIMYVVGTELIFSLPADISNKFYFRLIFRIGTIASSILFGLAFFVSTRSLSIPKVKDYLTMTSIGIIPIGITNEVSALQQTFGLDAHSLVFLSSYRFCIGLHSLSISISQDKAIRKSIRDSTNEVIELLDVGTTPRLKQEVEKKSFSYSKGTKVFPCISVRNRTFTYRARYEAVCGNSIKRSSDIEKYR